MGIPISFFLMNKSIALTFSSLNSNCSGRGKKSSTTWTSPSCSLELFALACVPSILKRNGWVGVWQLAPTRGRGGRCCGRVTMRSCLRQNRYWANASCFPSSSHRVRRVCRTYGAEAAPYLRRKAASYCHSSPSTLLRTGFDRLRANGKNVRVARAVRTRGEGEGMTRTVGNAVQFRARFRMPPPPGAQAPGSAYKGGWHPLGTGWASLVYQDWWIKLEAFASGGGGAVYMMGEGNPPRRSAPPLQGGDFILNVTRRRLLAAMG